MTLAQQKLEEFRKRKKGDDKPGNSYIKITQALKYVDFNMTRQTMISICKKEGIGKKFGGVWFVNRSKLIKYFDGV